MRGIGHIDNLQRPTRHIDVRVIGQQISQIPITGALNIHRTCKNRIDRIGQINDVQSCIT